jgi:hypothetical protein
MNWLQIRLFGPYFSSFSTNSYGYYPQMSQNLITNNQIFATALIVRQAARRPSTFILRWFVTFLALILSLGFKLSQTLTKRFLFLMPLCNVPHNGCDTEGFIVIIDQHHDGELGGQSGAIMMRCRD